MIAAAADIAARFSRAAPCDVSLHTATRLDHTSRESRVSNDLNFLADGAEMGALMRTHDWMASPLGRPETWPQSLRSIVGLLLGSKFPTFGAWEPELGFLYKAPYAEILGAKYPAALGARFYDVWSEIWPDISPLIDAAMAGAASFRQDLPLLMNRRGFDEQTWFTFSYSPVRDESGRVAGMFCACQETTDRVLAERRQAEETERQRRMFEQAPGFICTLRGPDHVFDFVNDTYKRLFGDRGFVGKTVRSAFPELAGQGFGQLLDEVYTTGVRHVANAAPLRLRRKPDALEEEERFLDFIYAPITDAAGAVVGIFCEGHDVTNAHRAQEALRDLNETLERRVAEALAERKVLADIVEGTDAFVQVAGLDFRWLAVNNAAAAASWRRRRRRRTGVWRWTPCSREAAARSTFSSSTTPCPAYRARR
ncbi:MAG TPA: PAS domain-containing protein [Stellaceae bacterium]